MRQSAAGADPDAAVRVGPKGFAVGVVPDQPVFRAQVPPGAAGQDGHSVGAAPPEAPQRVKAVKGRDLDRQGIGRHDRRRANNAVARKLHSLDSGIEAVVQPESAVRGDGRDVWVVAQKPVRFPVLAPPAIAQSPQPVGIGDPHGPLFVFRKGPRPVLQRRGLIDAAEAIGSGRPVVAKDAAGCGNPQPVQVVDETAVRSPAGEPVRRAEQTNLPGCRIDARHAARLHHRPDGAVGSLAQPSNVVAAQAVFPGPGPRRPAARPAAPSPERFPPRARLSCRAGCSRSGRTAGLAPWSRLPIRRNPASGPRRPRSAQSTAIPRDLPGQRWSSRCAAPAARL